MAAPAMEGVLLASGGWRGKWPRAPVRALVGGFVASAVALSAGPQLGFAPRVQAFGTTARACGASCNSPLTTPTRLAHGASPRPDTGASTTTPTFVVPAVLAIGLLGAGTATTLARRHEAGRVRKGRAPGVVALRFFPGGDDDDPYARSSAVKLQVGLSFSKSLLDTLNKLAETADTSSDEGLHELLLEVIVALRRSEASWRYGYCERVVHEGDNAPTQVGSTLQKWGVQENAKWGDGDLRLGATAPKGVTEYLVVTLMVGAYGRLGDKEEVKIRSSGDMKALFDEISGIQVQELQQLDVQWIPEETGDSLTAGELTMKFPELIVL